MTGARVRGDHMASGVKITVSVRGATKRDGSTGVFVGFCPALQIYSQGTNEERVQKALMAAVLLFLSKCIECGVLDKALKVRGFKDVTSFEAASPKEMIDEFVAIEEYDETFEFDVPLYLLHSGEGRSTAPC
jgi:hypothetical protein